MSKKNYLGKLYARHIIWLTAIAFLTGTIFLVMYYKVHPIFLSAPLLIFTVVAIDSFQNKHAVRRNYPLMGRLRYFFESIRPEFRQYFFENELDGKPFSRRQRSIVYQRAKNEKQTISFGMQDNPERIGYEWAAHSMYPKHPKNHNFRVTIGGSNCLQPYNASILNISAMSYGALSKTAIMALNEGAKLGNFAHNTGEGGISEYHLKGGDLIWQIGTGYFGCRDEEGNFSDILFSQKANLPEVKMIEIKISQGAKPGHGGLLPAKKNTLEIASIRNVKPHTTVHSPAGHTAFTDELGMLYFIDKLKHLSNGKPVGFKICIGNKKEFQEIVKAMVATRIFPDFITVDGAEGGTGAAPLEFIDHMGMSLIDALVFVNKELKKHHIRNEIKIIAAGKIISAFDMAKVLALGADVCYSARGMMFSLGCIQALQCDSGNCPVGIATQEKSLYKGLDVTNKTHRVANYHNNSLKAFAEFIGACGFESHENLTPNFIYRRISTNTIKSFHEIYYKNEEWIANKEMINLN